MSPAQQRLLHLINECAPDGAAALFRVFEDDELARLGAGTTCKARLDWLIRVTTGRPQTLPVPGLCMKYYWGDDSGLAAEFRDTPFDAGWTAEGKTQPFGASNQIGHFLTAVALSTLPIYRIFSLGLRLIIGHEKRSDQPPGVHETIVSIGQLLSTRKSDFGLFYKAVAIDEALDAAYGEQAARLRCERDRLLWQILEFDASVPFEGIDLKRPGNSLQDLRLSLKGYRFSNWVAAHTVSPTVEAARWFRRQLGARNANVAETGYPR